MIRCPHCETEDPRIVMIVEEVVRATYPTSLVEINGTVHDGIDGEADREVLDSDRDAATFQCQECYEDFDGEDVQDFLAEDEPEDDDAAGITCPGCGEDDEEFLPVLGTLGSREHRRCRGCGMTFSADAPTLAEA